MGDETRWGNCRSGGSGSSSRPGFLKLIEVLNSNVKQNRQSITFLGYVDGEMNVCSCAPQSSLLQAAHQQTQQQPVMP